MIDASGAGTTTRQKHYVGNYMVYTQSSGAINNNEYRFLLDDHLGSVDAITDVNGYVIERKGYDVFGQTRTGNWRNGWSGAFAVTDRGFTQHETLTDVGLIHMNGRAYDPKLGRFLSVDPVIQSPSFSQSLNGYAYVMNNPLSATDPTGYEAEEVEKSQNGVKKTDNVKKITVTVGKDKEGNEVRTVSGETTDGKKFSFTATSDGRSASSGLAEGEVVGNSSEIGSDPARSMPSRMTSFEGAKLSEAVYGKIEPPEGWKQVEGDELLKIFGIDGSEMNTESGLNAAVYYNKDKDIYALAFAGTNSKSKANLSANSRQADGQESTQYKEGISLARKFVQGLPNGSRGMYVGHSLGGGIASAAALKTSMRAYTYNAAGLHRNTVGGHIDQRLANRLILAFHSTSDMLTSLQTNTIPLYGGSSIDPFSYGGDIGQNINLPDAVGQRISVPNGGRHGIAEMSAALKDWGY